MADQNRILQRFYRWNAPIYDLTRWAILRGRGAAVAALELPPSGCVLDIGCGTGLNFAPLRRAIGPEGLIVGVDLSAHMLKRAQQRRLGGRVQIIQADAARLALDTRFDGVLCAYSLSMIPDWAGALAIAVEHLKPGGRLVILDFGYVAPGAPAWRRAFAWYLARNHVETQRDYAAGLRPVLLRVEHLRPADACVTLMRATR
ncbi:MAG TPA: class I SAM-dependent methyltransferase [Phycisphaerae bacterium]|nr:class I SAM-dependent methyltransferase [Phycisphaerae bacterium]HNU46353.1 class I SAM-dependent methyltransferase [Phycisphaerae bacterium]